jgi:hypothetical protein
MAMLNNQRVLISHTITHIDPLLAAVKALQIAGEVGLWPSVADPTRFQGLLPGLETPVKAVKPWSPCQKRNEKNIYCLYNLPNFNVIQMGIDWATSSK